MQIITLGIGPHSTIEQLVLTGLGISSSPPPPSATTPPGGIQLGVVTTLIADEDYALPPCLVSITVIAGNDLYVSLDGITWQQITLDSNNSFKTSAVFISSTGGNSVIIAKRIKPWQLN